MSRPFVFGQMMMMIMFGKMLHPWCGHHQDSHPRLSIISTWLQMKSHDDGHCPVTFIIERNEWETFLFVSSLGVESILTAATFKNSHNQHLRMYFEPSPFLEAQMSDEWISVRSYLEPWEYPSPASFNVQTWSHDAGDMVECVYVRVCLMDGPDIKLGILQTAESEGESDWSFVVRKFFYSNQWNAFKASLPSQRNWERNTNSPSRRVRNSTQNLTTTRGFSWKTKNILCSSQDG